MSFPFSVGSDIAADEVDHCGRADQLAEFIAVGCRSFASTLRDRNVMASQLLAGQSETLVIIAVAFQSVA
jgi:hypothetical protein